MADFDRAGGLDSAPPTNKTLIVIASILLVIPIVALLWVGSYARETPRLGALRELGRRLVGGQQGGGRSGDQVAAEV